MAAFMFLRKRISIVNKFDINKSKRNSHLIKTGFDTPKSVKTGTTIVGAIFKDGVVVGADSRATSGNIIADKNCLKVNRLTNNIYSCGAGSAADLQHTANLISSQLELHALNTGRTVPGTTACRMLKQMLFRYQGYISVYSLVGGVDNNGPFVYQISANGCSQKVPYDADGSGSLAAMSILESRWKPNMELEDAKKLVCDSVTAGGMNDLASGNIVNLAVITAGKSEVIRPYRILETKGEREGHYDYKRGTTAVLSTRTIPLEVEDVLVKKTEDSAMDTS